MGKNLSARGGEAAAPSAFLNTPLFGLENTSTKYESFVNSPNTKIHSDLTGTNKSNDADLYWIFYLIKG